MPIANLLPQKIIPILLLVVACMLSARPLPQGVPAKEKAPLQEKKSDDKKPKAKVKNDVEILSDTMGVDFGPYIKRLRYRIQRYWETLLPPVALSPSNKSGTVTIEFVIARDGKVQGMKFMNSSGSVALDQAAWHAITEAEPLPILPLEFKDNYLQLRCNFSYNPPPAKLAQ